MHRAALALLLLLPGLGQATEPLEQTLTISEHRFTPAEIRVPAGKKIKLTIVNQDGTPEEFDSKELNREKVVLGKSKGVVFIGPLKPGKYSFMGEFNPATAQGVVIAE